MNKSALLVLNLLLLVCLILTTLFFSFSMKNDYERTYTSAICLDNVCRDYLFTCLDGEIIESNPISGFVTFDEDWVDKREDKNRC